jgi:hypothetical protein
MAPQRKKDNMITITSNGRNGRTCGLRKDGSRAIQWDDNSIDWFSAEAFSDILWLSESSILATEV